MVVLISTTDVYSQVGVGTFTPNNSAQLDIVASNKGILIPRVSLQSNTDTSTITSGNIESLLVYNTNTASSITPGYYYWYNNKWHRIITDQNFINQVVTTLVDNGDGTYTYKSEDGTITVIDIPANETLTSLVYDATANTLTYVDEHKNGTVINLQTLVRNVETITTLIDNSNGTYTYTNEKGVQTTIDSNHTDVLTTIAMNPDNVHIDYKDEAGNITQLDLTQAIKNLETTTTLVDNANGTYTYTNEKGTTSLIDVPSSVINNATTIFNTTNVVNEIIPIIKSNETLTSQTQNLASGDITFTDEDGASSIVKVTSANAGNLLTTGTDGGSFLNQASIQANETLTSQTQNLTSGDITFTDEDGASSVVKVTSANAGNLLTTGTDGGSFLNQSAIASNETNTTLSIAAGALAYTNEDSNNANVNLISTDVNNAVAAGGDGALFVDRNALAIEPWLVETTGDKATLNTQNIYQTGRVAIGGNTFSKQLDVHGDFKSVFNASDGLFHAVEVNNLDTGAPITAMFASNAAAPFSASQSAMVSVSGNGADLIAFNTVSQSEILVFPNQLTLAHNSQTTSSQALISVRNDQGIRYQFNDTSGGFLGEYIFPKTNGSTGQVLTTNGNIPTAQLEWTDPKVNGVNGLTSSGIEVKLGGVLTEPTTITTDATNTLAIAGLQQSTAQNDKIVVTDVNGVVKNVSSAMPKFFYMPAIIFDTAVISPGLTKNLYTEYTAQFQAVTVKSVGAPADIPFLPAATDLYYYITYYDPTVFSNLSIDANGVLTYDIIGNGTPTSFMNIVFVVK